MHSTYVQRTAAALLLGAHVLATTGCTSWKTQRGDVATVITPPPRSVEGGSGESAGTSKLVSAQPVSTAKPDTVRQIRVTTSTQGTIDLRNPRVANDSLYGQTKKNGPETSYALGDITSVKTKGFSALDTGFLVVGVAAVSLAAMVGVYAASCGGNCQ